MSFNPTIKVGCRASPLSRAQFQEVADALPHLHLEPHSINTGGDLDKKTSLRSLEKTDFFTKEIDKAQLKGKVRLSVHSAKDLPEPLPEGLTLAALTEGKEPHDVLVLRDGETLSSLPQKARIATSSERREVSVRTLRSDLTFVDIRGNIGERLKTLDGKSVDGVVIAQAALTRLGIERTSVMLPGKTAPMQGQLAILARQNDWEMRAHLSSIDVRKNLYLGLDPCTDLLAFPYPVIQIERLTHVTNAPGTHLVITSKTAARLLLEDLSPNQLQDKTLIVIGKKTARMLKEDGLSPHHIAKEETSEGITSLLSSLDLKGAHLFWPHSAGSRPVLANFLSEARTPYTEVLLYRTLPFRPFPPPPLERFDQITFTSPSTVTGFLALYGELPQNKEIRAKGPVTQEALQRDGQLALGKVF